MIGGSFNWLFVVVVVVGGIVVNCWFVKWLLFVMVVVWVLL